LLVDLGMEDILVGLVVNREGFLEIKLAHPETTMLIFRIHILLPRYDFF
jgi:hypothetical protein